MNAHATMRAIVAMAVAILMTGCFATPPRVASGTTSTAAPRATTPIGAMQDCIRDDQPASGIGRGLAGAAASYGAAAASTFIPGGGLATAFVVAGNLHSGMQRAAQKKALREKCGQVYLKEYKKYTATP